MRIETLCDIGDIIKYKAVGNKEHTKDCPFCDGEGYRNVDGEIIHCQNCEEGIIRIKSSTIVEIIGEIECIDFRNFGSNTSSNEVLYRCKVKSETKDFRVNWCKETDIIELLKKYNN